MVTPKLGFTTPPLRHSDSLVGFSFIQSEGFLTTGFYSDGDGVRGVALREDRQSVALFGNYEDGQAVVLLDSDDGTMVWVWQVKHQQ